MPDIRSIHNKYDWNTLFISNLGFVRNILLIFFNYEVNYFCAYLATKMRSGHYTNSMAVVYGRTYCREYLGIYPERGTMCTAIIRYIKNNSYMYSNLEETIMSYAFAIKKPWKGVREWYPILFYPSRPISRLGSD